MQTNSNNPVKDNNNEENNNPLATENTPDHTNNPLMGLVSAIFNTVGEILTTGDHSYDGGGIAERGNDLSVLVHHRADEANKPADTQALGENNPD